MQLIRKIFTAPAEKDAKDDTFTFIASDETEDRYGDVVRVAGWELENFRKNPVFLLAHSTDTLPIGTVTSIEKRTEGTPRLVARVKFASTEAAKNVETLYREGVMKAVSVGFMALEYQPRANGYEFLKQELFELSAVAVPANPNALLQRMLQTKPDVLRAILALRRAGVIR